jgi:hypothetical protein
MILCCGSLLTDENAVKIHFQRGVMHAGVKLFPACCAHLSISAPILREMIIDTTSGIVAYDTATTGTQTDRLPGRQMDRWTGGA